MDQPVSQPSQPSSTPTITAEPITTVSQPPKKKFPLILIIVVVVLLVGVGLIVFFLQQQRGADGIPLSLPGVIDEGSRDNFDGDNLNVEKWNTWSTKARARIEQRGGRVEIEIPAGNTEYTSGGIDWGETIIGNFEATVDLSFPRGGENAGSDVGFIFRDESEDWLNQLSIFLRNEEDGSFSLRAVSIVNGTSTDLGSKPHSSSGPFTIRIARSGGSATFSVEEGGKFVVLGEATAGVYRGGGKITLHVNSYGPNFPPVLATFDNFLVKVK